MTPAKDQTEFDWPRATKLRVLERLHFPKHLGVSGSSMVAVLKCLDSHAREREACWLYLETISNETHLTKRTARKALGVLRAARFVSTTRTGRSNVWQIEWSNLIEYETKTRVKEERKGHSEWPPAATQKGLKRPLRVAAGGHSKEAPLETPLETQLKTPAAEPRRSKEAVPPEAAAEPPGERNSSEEKKQEETKVLGESDRRFLAIAEVVLHNKSKTCVRNSDQDLDLVWCVARLVVRREISEDTLAQALEAVTLNRPRNKPAYFRSALVAGCKKAGFSFHALEKNHLDKTLNLKKRNHETQKKA